MWSSPLTQGIKIGLLGYGRLLRLSQDRMPIVFYDRPAIQAEAMTFFFFFFFLLVSSASPIRQGISEEYNIAWMFLVRYIVTGCIFRAPSAIWQGQVLTPPPPRQRHPPIQLRSRVPPPPPPGVRANCYWAIYTKVWLLIFPSLFFLVCIYPGKAPGCLVTGGEPGEMPRCCATAPALKSRSARGGGGGGGGLSDTFLSLRKMLWQNYHNGVGVLL